MQEETSFSVELIVSDGELRIDSRLIAQGINIQHESIMKTIRKYQSGLEKYGVIRFEIGKPTQGSSGGRPGQYTCLNREQIGYLLMFLKVNDIVRSFREHVYDKFLEYEKRQPSTEPIPIVPQHKLTDLLAERAKLNMSSVPSHYFSVMGVLFLHIYNLENMVKDLDAQARIENSTGICWSNYATDTLHIPDYDKVRYQHILPNGKVVEAWAYSHKWQRDFEVWLWTIYFPEKFPKYFGYRVRKVAKNKGLLEAPKVRQIEGGK